MQIEDILSELQASDLLETVKPHWLESMASFPDGGPDFLRSDQIRTNLQWCGLEAELEPALVCLAGKISAKPPLLYLAWHYYRTVYDYSRANNPPFRLVPLENTLGDDAAMFYLLIALAIVPRIRIFHRRLGVPERVTRETCLQVKCMCGNYRRVHNGRPGIFEQIQWLQNYVNGALYFRLGRFEYWSKPFAYDYKVYRRRLDGRTIALAGPAWKINSSGLIEGIGAEKEAGACWQTTLKQIGANTYGFPINPGGFVEPDLICLPDADWECVLEKNVPVLEMHIPAGGDMSLEKCADSFRQAFDFFGRFFPSPAPRAIVTHSWMFSPILEQILPADSNLAKFMRELYICPVNSRGTDSLWFVFLQKPLDLATAPRETSLQRAILNHLQAGNTWHNGGMFFMLDDLGRFGRQWHRTAYSTADLSFPAKHCRGQ